MEGRMEEQRERGKEGGAAEKREGGVEDKREREGGEGGKGGREVHVGVKEEERSEI